MYENRKKISIDSLKLRIPLEFVQIIDHRLTDSIMLVSSESGEILETAFKLNSVKHSENGIKTSYCKNSIYNLQTHVNDYYLDILFNAKLLKERYLEGITIDNYMLCYDEIIKQKIINIDVNIYKSGRCLDIDFKYDYTCTVETFVDQINLFERMAVKKNKRDQGSFKFNQSKNKGIEFSKRTTSSYLASPFLKFYYKTFELMFNESSQEFRNTYLGNYLTNPDIVDLARVEATVKNATHLKSINAAFKSDLATLLSQYDLFPQIIKNHFYKTFTGRLVVKKIKKALEGKDVLISVMLQESFKQYETTHINKDGVKVYADIQTLEYNVNRYWMTIENNFKIPNQKYRFKKLLNEIICNTVEDFKESNFKEIEQFFN